VALNLFNCDVEQRCVSRDRDMHSVRSTVLRLTFVVVNRRRNAQRTSSIVLAKSIAGAIELCIVNQLSCKRIYVTHKAFISETSQTTTYVSDVQSPPRVAVHRNAAIYEIQSFWPYLAIVKIDDDISNGSRVIVLTDKRTNKHPDTHKRTPVKT